MTDATPAGMPVMPPPDATHGIGHVWGLWSLQKFGRQCYEAGRTHEREACAKLCDEDDIPYLAAEIRSRGTK